MDTAYLAYLVVIVGLLAPFLYAMHIMNPESHVDTPAQPVPQRKVELVKTKKSKPKSTPITTTSTTTTTTTKYSKKKKLQPPTHARFVGWVKGHTSGVVSCAVSPDGQFFAASCNDRTLRVTRMNDCLQRQGTTKSGGSNTPLYMSTQTNFTVLSSICWAPSQGGAVIVGVQESDRNIVFYRCRPKAKAAQYSDSAATSSTTNSTASDVAALDEKMSDLIHTIKNTNMSTQKKNALRKELQNLESTRIQTASDVNRAASKKTVGFRYEIKNMPKKTIASSCLDTCRFVAMDQSSASTKGNVEGPTIVTGYSDGSTSLRTVLCGLDGSERCAFKTRPGASKSEKGYAFATSRDCKLVGVVLSSGDVSIHKHEASTGMSRKPVMQLAGVHQRVVTGIALGGRASAGSYIKDTDRAVTCSRDGTWSLWKIDVQYKFNEEPIKMYQSDNVGSPLTAIALSPNGSRVVVVGGEGNNTLWIYSLREAGIHDAGIIEKVGVIEIGHAEGPITHVQFGPDSRYVSVASVGSKVVYLWSTE